MFSTWCFSTGIIQSSSIIVTFELLKPASSKDKKTSETQDKQENIMSFTIFFKTTCITSSENIFFQLSCPCKQRLGWKRKISINHEESIRWLKLIWHWKIACLRSTWSETNMCFEQKSDTTRKEMWESLSHFNFSPYPPHQPSQVLKYAKACIVKQAWRFTEFQLAHIERKPN